MSKRTAAAIDKLIVASGVGALMANHYYLLPEMSDFLKEHSWSVLAIFMVSVIFQVLTPLEYWVAWRQRPSRKQLEDKIIRSCGSVVQTAVDAGLKVEDVALHLWRVGRPTRAFWRRRLMRVSTYRLGMVDHLTNPSFQPKAGIGAVGQCWKRNNSYSYDRSAHSPMPANRQEYDTEFEKDPDRFNCLTWDQFERFRHIEAIFTAPIRSSARFVGCVSVDAPRMYDELKAAGMQSKVNDIGQKFGPDDLRQLR